MGLLRRVCPALFLLPLLPLLPISLAKRSSYDYTPNGESAVLYHPGLDKVMNLDEETFRDTVLNASKPIIVELYKDWCGHCRKFAPTYRAFAKSVENWRDVLDLAVINCADLHNRKACREAQQVGKRTVPSMKFFPAGAMGVGSAGDEFEFDPPNRTVEAMRTQLVKTLMENGSVSLMEEMGVSTMDLEREEMGNANGNGSDRYWVGGVLSWILI